MAKTMSEIEQLKVRVGEMAMLCLNVRDAVNKYHHDKTSNALEELERLVARCNSPQLLNEVQTAVSVIKDHQAVTLFAVHEGDDDRSSGTPRWFFRSKKKAKQVAWKRGWFGGNAPVSEQRVIVVGDRAYLLDPRRTEPVSIDVSPDDELAAKQKAMAKLTPEERKILGIQ